MSIMRVAVAGTGGLARHIVYFIQEQTSHQVVFLSRTAHPDLSQRGYHVLQVDYNDPEGLIFALRGIDTVISTVTGPNQLRLIHAAIRAHVRRFAPAEFGARSRPSNDPLDRGYAEARQLLVSQSHRIQSTNFVCGMLYERFQPGGLRASTIGVTSGASGEGDYLIDVRNMRAQLPVQDANGSPNVVVCLTAAQDVARFVTRALEETNWPAEYRIYGHRIRVVDLAGNIAQLRGQRYAQFQRENPASLHRAIQVAMTQRNPAEVIRLHTLLATANGRFDFTQSDWARLLPDQQPLPFYDWLASVWNIPPQQR